MGSEKSLSYILFSYRNALQRSKPNKETLCKEKIALSKKLININLDHLEGFSTEDEAAFNKIGSYKKKLERQLERIKAKKPKKSKREKRKKELKRLLEEKSKKKSKEQQKM